MSAGSVTTVVRGSVFAKILAQIVMVILIISTIHHIGNSLSQAQRHSTTTNKAIATAVIVRGAAIEGAVTDQLRGGGKRCFVSERSIIIVVIISVVVVDDVVATANSSRRPAFGEGGEGRIASSTGVGVIREVTVMHALLRGENPLRVRAYKGRGKASGSERGAARGGRGQCICRQRASANGGAKIRDITVMVGKHRVGKRLTEMIIVDAAVVVVV